MSSRIPICFHCREKGLPSNHWSKNKPGPEGVVVCKVMLANRKCNYCKETGHLKAECPKLLLKQQPVPIAAPSSAPKAPPGSWAAITASNRDAKLVAQIEEETAQIKAQKQAKVQALAEKSRQEYLEREARRQEKKRIAEELAKAKEDAHVADMIEKWGHHRWHRMVEDTEDDCRIAADLRYKEMEEEEREYYEMQEREKEWEKEWEKERVERDNADNKRENELENARRTMSEEEFKVWVDHNYADELDDHFDNFWAMSCDDYFHIERMRRQAQEDKARLARWEEKQKK